MVMISQRFSATNGRVWYQRHKCKGVCLQIGQWEAYEDVPFVVAVEAAADFKPRSIGGPNVTELSATAKLLRGFRNGYPSESGIWRGDIFAGRH